MTEVRLFRRDFASFVSSRVDRFCDGRFSVPADCELAGKLREGWPVVVTDTYQGCWFVRSWVSFGGRVEVDAVDYSCLVDRCDGGSSGGVKWRVRRVAPENWSVNGSGCSKVFPSGAEALAWLRAELDGNALLGRWR